MSNSSSSSHLPAVADLESIQLLGDVEFTAERAVTLRGDAAKGVADSLGRATQTGLDILKRDRLTVYELVPSDATKTGLANGKLKWATPRKGDASIMVKDDKAGRIAGHGELRRAKPKPASVLGPAVWQAMAVATQQHYLNEINEKLADLDANLDEVMARLTEADRAPLTRAAKLAELTATAMNSGERVSVERVRELRGAADRADEVWHKLLGQTQRHVREYRDGTKSPEDVEQSFGMLLKATEALVACADVTVELPHRDADELASIAREEGERIFGAITELRALGDEMCLVNSEWARQWSVFHGKQEGKPKLLRTYQSRRPIKKLRKPKQDTLSDEVWRRSQALTGQTPPLERLLVEVTADGHVRVAAAG